MDNSATARVEVPSPAIGCWFGTGFRDVLPRVPGRRLHQANEVGGHAWDWTIRSEESSERAGAPQPSAPAPATATSRPAGGYGRDPAARGRRPGATGGGGRRRPCDLDRETPARPPPR